MAAQDLEEGAKEGKGHRRMETRERNRSEFGMSVGLLFIIFIIRPPLLARRRGGRCDEAGGTDGTRRDPALLPPRRRPWRRLAMALRDGGAREARQ